MSADIATTAPQRRTKRRLAHELYPHPAEGEARDLAVDVPYLYAQFVGLRVWGTDWRDDRTKIGLLHSHSRIAAMAEAGRTALLADALHQGLAGQEAWTWANERVSDDMELVYDRALHYGIDTFAIRPYQHVNEPDHHDHYAAPNARGARVVTRVDGRETECPDCTEEIPA